ncbi:MAG: 3-deoxy-8-phosphooctulonate synthase [Bacteroidota bacterium]
MNKFEFLTNPIPGRFFLMAGPCVVEDEQMPMEIGKAIFQITQKYNIPFIFKASFKKANRTRLDSFTGIGDLKALEKIAEVGSKLGIPVVTDIHTADDAVMAAEYVDILQIPAFLCRQTDLLIAAANTGKIINVKKGQFVEGSAMRFAIDKIRQSGNTQPLMLTERGSMFGYQDLVVDFRNIPLMRKIGVPVVVDITHSLQQPNQASGVSGGNPELIETIAMAGIATGAEGIFLETHPEPSRAKSDGANMLPLDNLDALLRKLVRLKEAVDGI